MFHPQTVRLQVEYLEDRVTPSVSPFESLFSQLTSALQNLSPPTFPSISFPSLPQLPSLDLPTLPDLDPPSLPSFPQLPSLPSFPQISLPSVPTLPSFPQFPFDNFSDLLSGVVQAAHDRLEQLNSEAANLFEELADNLLSHFQP
jgi:hypothetical protein